MPALSNASYDADKLLSEAFKEGVDAVEMAKDI